MGRDTKKRSVVCFLTGFETMIYQRRDTRQLIALEQEYS